MRIVVASFQVPFNRGGASFLANDLVRSLEDAGHSAELVTLPFRFFPDAQVTRAMATWASEDFRMLNYAEPDLVIPLSFPAYYCVHPRKRVWLMHQFRAAYELKNNDPLQGLSDDTRSKIVATDQHQLSLCERVFTISKRVSERLLKNNGIESKCIYHPPPDAERYYSEKAQPFIFAPSRIESLKRQSLLVEAMTHVQSPVAAVISGMGGQFGALRDQVTALGLEGRVRLIGSVSQEEKIAFFAHSLGVYFAPYDEDYGYVTLEAMLAAKPVITAKDSGGPLEFVEDGETGYVVEPTPQAVATAIDALYDNPRRAAGMGGSGRALYDSLGLSWKHTIDTLLAGA